MNNIELFKKNFDPYLKEYLNKKIRNTSDYTGDPFIQDYIRYIKKLILAGGKRIRPYIAFLIYEILGGKEKTQTLKFLVSLELFHSFCLVHDDIMDKAGFRHGIKSINKYILGKLNQQKRLNDLVHIANSQSILSGDLLFNWSYEILNLNNDFSQKIMQKIRIIFHKMADEVIVGQMIDVDTTTRKKVSKELIDEKTRLKTAGYSFIKPLQIGAALAGKNAKKVEKFCKEFGLAMGIAFQTQDDLLDITSSDKKLQKTTSLDKSQNQHTYFTYFKSLEEGKKIMEKNFNKAKDLVKKLSINGDAKKKFLNLIELIQTRTF